MISAQTQAAVEALYTQLKTDATAVQGSLVVSNLNVQAPVGDMRGALTLNVNWSLPADPAGTTHSENWTLPVAPEEKTA